MNYKGKRVGIIGYGVNNRELVPLLQERGAKVTILDMDPTIKTPGGVEAILGPHYLDALTDYDIVFRTPKLPFLHEKIQAAMDSGVVVTSQTELFLEECPCRVIAVTGTKGKGTTASFIASMLGAANRRGDIPGKTYLAGNIGVSPIGLLDTIGDDDWIVLELSSFQTQDISRSPHIAVILNITEDHLDHHQSVEEYHEAKRNLVRRQDGDDYIVVNHDSPVAMTFLDITSAQPYFYSGRQAVEPGAFVKGDTVVANFDLERNRLVVRSDELATLGRHNLENCAAATVAAFLAGATIDSIAVGARAFKGLPFHTEFIAEKDGVRYFNDSFATNPEATKVAIAAFDTPIILIAGGSPKGADFNDLARAISQSTVKTVVCIGQEGSRIREALLRGAPDVYAITGKSTMEDIVRQCASLAKPGEVVLLSPACASLDMFKDYKDRGQQFNDAVNRL